MPSSKQRKQQQQDVDERFSRVQRDPRFWEMPEKQHKVKIDKRFQSMFHDQRFKVKYTVDKRGRPVNHTTAEDLKRFYQLSDEEEEEEEETKEKRAKVEAAGTGLSAEDEGDEDDEGLSVSSDEEEEEDSGGSESDSDSGPDLARGKGNVETSSDEDEEEEDEVEAALRREEEEIEHDWGELCKDAPRTEQVSHRLAVCNMDWDRIKAKDLLALFQSFSPKGGAVLWVKIFLSGFGRERLQQETSQGPMELRALPEDSEDDTEEEKVYREKLRDYQFKRLKYYFAVVECDSSDTAAQIYSECDGFEYESSCSVLDLRFIPDDMTFEDEPKDEASDVNLSSYTPNLFTSAASSTSKVQLTWDETDHERVTALNRKFNRDELLNMDFKAYLASSSDEEEEEDGGSEHTVTENPTTAEGDEVLRKSKKRSEEQLSKYRELLKGIQDKEKQQKQDRDMEMEVTWVPGLKENAEQLLKKRLETKEPLTPWGQFLQKKKEKKRQKKDQRKQGADLSGDDDDDDDVPSDVNLSDPFFSEELSAAGLTPGRGVGGSGSDLRKKPKKKKKEEEERTAEEEEELQRQKAQMELLMEDDADEARHKHFDFDRIVEQQNLSKNKRKRLKKSGLQPQEDQFQVDVADPRFQAVYTSPLFSLDPSHPSFRRTKGTESLLQEKQRRRQDTRELLGPVTTTTTHSPVSTTTTAAAVSTATSRTESGLDPALSQLVKSIKSKTQQFQARKKHRPQ